MKKVLLLVSLITALSSCGGGGGGGGSSQTGSTTPVPNNPNQSGNNQPGNSNIQNPNQSGNNQSGNSNAQNPSQPGSNNASNFEKPSDNRIFEGNGVKIGVLDSDFLSGNNARTNHFHARVGSDGFLQNDTFTKVIEEEFGNRMTTIAKNNTRPLDKSDHGLIVATILAGNSGKGAKKSEVYGASISNSTAYQIDIEYYRQMYNNGVRIYNQSFGQEHVRFDNLTAPNYNKQLQRTIYIPAGNYTEDQLKNKADEIIKFYEDAVEAGSLFVWAAGNRPLYGVDFEAGLPYYNEKLRKGWIAAIGVKIHPDGTITDYPNRLAYAGGAAYWSIAANGDCELPECSSNVKGSSFAAPRITATAAKLKEKFPWMTGHEIQQTILTTASKVNENDARRTAQYGWGILNEKKALKGPAEFDNILLVGKNADLAGRKGQFNANIGNSMTSIFENDITGDAGLRKSGNGTLILTGNNTYLGNTTIDEGILEIYGDNGSNITINSQGTLVTYPKAVIGLKDSWGLTPKNVKNEGGRLENRGSGAVITGNYTATAGSVTKAEIGSKLIVNGSVNLNGGNTTLQTLSNGRYITAKSLSSTIIEAKNGINGNFDKVETPELIKGSVEKTDNQINVKLSRKNILEYAKETKADEMQQNTAQNIESAFQKLDEEIENGKAGNLSSFEKKAATLQALDLTNRAAILDSLSGQIYASAQALTFQHSQTVNKDLSNRLVMLGTLDNVGDNFGLWVSSFGANGKLEQNGYGKGDTKVFGGQVGIDKQFGDNLILGTALSYSKADVKFNRYGGKSDASNFGVSLYGRLGNKDIPWYLQGRFGVGFVDSDVERDIILSSNDYSRAKINHNDKVYSGYVETGYDIKNSNGDFVVTPFAGITHDTVTRGSFSEDKSQFGLKANKKNYNQTSALAGVRVGKAVQWNGGSKTTFQGYVTHQRAFNDEDLSFKAEYSGLPGSSFKVKGIGLSKSKTKAGVGALTEVNSSFGWYVNYDGEISSGKGKGNNNVVTTGLRFNF
ncbi:autotransporter domain-containing protein [Leptotrichia buccalis]